MSKERNSMIFIVAIVACVAVVGVIAIVKVSINQKNEFGQVIAPVSGPNVEKKNCTDTDGGIVYNVFGMVYGQKNKIPFSFNDTCVNSSMLREYYCQNSNPLSNDYNCPYKCQKGSCINITPDSCSDPDSNNTFILGITTGYRNGVEYRFYDTCISHSNLLEFLCYENKATNITVSCLRGCNNGACIQDPAYACNDSDGGENYNVRGTIFIGQSPVQTDYCTDTPSQLIEYVCRDYYYYYNQSYICPYGCYEGRCMNQNESCNPGWICYDHYSLAYLNPNCQYSNITNCPYSMPCQDGNCLIPNDLILHYVGFKTDGNCARWDSNDCNSPSYIISQENTLAQCCNSRYPQSTPGIYQNFQCNGFNIFSCGCTQPGGCDILCRDGILNGFERSIDCGGDCPPCPINYLQYAMKGDLFMCRPSSHQRCDGIGESQLLESLQSCCNHFYGNTTVGPPTGDSCYLYTEITCN